MPPATAEFQDGLAEALDGSGRSDEAIAIWERLVRADPEQARYQRSLADAYNQRAMRESRAARAIEWHLKALPLREALVRRDPEDPGFRFDLGQTLNNLGVLLNEQGQVRESLAMYERAVQHIRFGLREDAPGHRARSGPLDRPEQRGSRALGLDEREAAVRWLPGVQ